ncbi:hypothetical protein HK102_006329, partial [Quaeritorhiza haematococci]
MDFNDDLATAEEEEIMEAAEDDGTENDKENDAVDAEANIAAGEDGADEGTSFEEEEQPADLSAWPEEETASTTSQDSTLVAAEADVPEPNQTPPGGTPVSSQEQINTTSKINPPTDDIIRLDFPHPFSQPQLQALRAIADAFFPTLTKQETEELIKYYHSRVSHIHPHYPQRSANNTTLKNSLTDHQLEEYAQYGVLSTPPFTHTVVPVLVKSVIEKTPPDIQSKLSWVLWLLSTSVGCWALTGVRRAPFYELNRQERERALLNWKYARLGAFNGVFCVLRSAVMLAVYGEPTEWRQEGNERAPGNPTWRLLGYPGPDPLRPKVIENVFHPQFLDIPALAAEKGVVAKSSKPLVLEYDVVIVGSGAGGGVVASELAKSGHKVIVLEKSLYTPPTHYSLLENESLSTLFEGGGLQSEDNSIAIMAGSAWGGGTTVNWSASLRLPYSVREEWSKRFGLDYFLTKDYSDAVDAVCRRLGVTTEGVKHNATNQILVDGCERLGYPSATIPQNTAGLDHDCGWCTFGCPYGRKQSSTLTWLKDAQEAGAHFVQGCYVKRILTKNGRAVGVSAEISHPTNPAAPPFRLIIRAPTVVVSAGSIHSPALLLRSGFKNPHIGQNLHLHPVTVVTGIFPNRSDPIDQFSGSIMTSVSTVASNVDGKGYGALIETPIYHPFVAGMFHPWRSALDHRKLMSFFNRQAALIVLTRDYDSRGTVHIDKDGKPRVNYAVSPHDAKSMAHGVEAALNILVAAGAAEVVTSINGVPNYVAPSLSTASIAAPPTTSSTSPTSPSRSVTASKLTTLLTTPFQKTPSYTSTISAVRSSLKKTPSSPHTLNLFSAHQMGTCRMAKNAREGVCDERGRVWECRGVWVADASLFPTASGVNPMITTYSVAYSVAQFIKQKLERKRVKEEGILQDAELVMKGEGE